MGDEDRFVGAEWLLRKVMAANGTEEDVGSDSMTVEQFMDGITEACGQAAMDTRLETVADDVFAANEDS
ncbi:hypothetical protein AB0C61_20910 [Streptomyces sp. NPDC048680]|uniref:hypothetical protein n=1 Tax=Streptomyces sp. NPDC048680 TaxID=3155492 RepID=UPI003437D695